MIITCKYIELDKYANLIQNYACVYSVYIIACVYPHMYSRVTIRLTNMFFSWKVHVSRPAEHSASGGHRNRFNKECGKAKSCPMKMRDASKKLCIGPESTNVNDLNGRSTW